MSSLEKYLFTSSLHFKIRLFVFLLLSCMYLLLWLTSPGCNKNNDGPNDAGQFDPWECLLNSEALAVHTTQWLCPCSSGPRTMTRRSSRQNLRKSMVIPLTLKRLLGDKQILSAGDKTVLLWDHTTMTEVKSLSFDVFSSVGCIPKGMPGNNVWTICCFS